MDVNGFSFLCKINTEKKTRIAGYWGSSTECSDHCLVAQNVPNANVANWQLEKSNERKETEK